MAAFHKPKLYRSHDGCCICKAKSSSSRFTSSAKYESYFPSCFKLEEVRAGQVCNACVLIVKRWRNLPEDSSKHWAHVVDARIGPGVKTVQRPRDPNPLIFAKIKKKVPHKKVLPEKEAQTKREIKTPDIPDFLDSSYWTRKTVCCGVIYVGQRSEVMLDQRFYQKCSNHRQTQPPVDCQSLDLCKNSEVASSSSSSSSSDTKMVDDATFSEFSDSESFTSREDDVHYTDTDEGFQVC